MGALVKYIYWHGITPTSKNHKAIIPNSEPESNYEMASVHVLEGYNDGSITAFQNMATILRKTFPKATDDEIKCGHVIKSMSVDGYSIITWTGQIKRRKYRGWYDREPNSIMEYNWY